MPNTKGRPSTYAYRPMNDATSSMAYQGRCAKNSITADLNTRSPTANMWSRPGMTRAFAPGTSAASASGEPAIESLLADRDHERHRHFGDLTAAQRLPRTAHAGGERV